MQVNVGTLDRVVRAVLGVVLLWLAFFSGFPAMEAGALKWLAAVVGVVMLVVAAFRVCPIYSIFGIRTCRT
ncbi:YgaP family membrane protein [Psychromarinibacter sp. S121]|uniref:YgaP family membrane protein n=1 Tax=Psychromarinibacter sp. S121 TaxID=3415127 RepID=UPI003C7D6035